MLNFSPKLMQARYAYKRYKMIIAN